MVTPVFAPHSHRMPRALVVSATLATLVAAGSLRAAEEPAQLKWTPHRAATAPRQTSAAPAPADPTPAADGTAAVPPAAGPVGPPASVSLPATVAPAAPRGTQASSEPFAPLRSRPGDVFGDWSSANRMAGRLQQVFDPSNLGTPRLRSPEPPARAAAASRQRPERLAMNVDGIPSVMAQGPQVGALDDTRVPGRSPGVPRTMETVPAPGRSLPDGGGMNAGEGPTIIEMMPGEEGFDPSLGADMDMNTGMGGGDDLLLGGFPAEMHVESFYDDPYACEDDECGLPLFNHHGAICNWLRQFGRPYYGWRWYRDFTASAGVTAFENETNLGLRGNFGTNEYLNWAMPFWNAFGIGWQVGARGVQSNFQSTTVTTPGGRLQTNARDQVFVTTGFFTRAFEGRGLQGGAVYDYLSDSWYDNSDVSQIRSEISYVWGYHEFGYWGAHNIGDQSTIFGPIRRNSGVASSLDMYCGFYRLQFGDANEWKVWGGAVDGGGGLVGSMLRAPISRSWALESTFTYVIPDKSKTVTIDEQGSSITFAPTAWNLGINLVYYPAARARRSLASPYRPLFEVADNGSMIRSISGTGTP